MPKMKDPSKANNKFVATKIDGEHRQMLDQILLKLGGVPECRYVREKLLPIIKRDFKKLATGQEAL